MKIAFRGFRGFGHDTDFIEINALTIFTGKNGSGKSTFIKLLQLFSNFIKPTFGVQESNFNFEQLIGTSIKIGNEILGGATNLLHDAKKYNPEIVIRQRFDFYTFEHDVHFIFECSEYNLKLIKISIYDTESNEFLMECDASTVTSDLENLYNNYIKAGENYNLCTNYLLDKQSTMTDDTKEPELLRYHKNYDKFAAGVGLDDYCSNKTQEEIDNYPFFFKSIKLDSKFFFRVSMPNEVFQINPKDLKNIIKSFDEELYDNPPDIYFYDELIQSIDFPEEFNEKLAKITNTLLKKLPVPINQRAVNHWAVDGQMNVTILTMLKEMEIDNLYDDFGNLENVIEAVILSKSHISAPLIMNTFNIYQSGVSESLKVIENINIHSSVKAVGYRSFNLFNYENSFSHFLRYFRASSINNRKVAISEIKAKLNEFKIANDIEIEIHDTTAFIYLIKGSTKIPLIDDGSGINNLVSLLLFLSTPKKIGINQNEENIPDLASLFSEESQLFLKSNEIPAVFEIPDIIVLEEPESNLHPNLQSKIADLIVDYITRSDTKVIIETHSEYLIRKLQYLVSKGKCKSDDVVIYYFDFDPFSGNKDIQFYSIDIRENGTLTREFGPGFLDEADNLAINLFTLVQSQNN